MRVYKVFFKVLGGEWQLSPASELELGFITLEEALCRKDSLASPIKEAMVVSVDTDIVYSSNGKKEVIKRYELLD